MTQFISDEDLDEKEGSKAAFGLVALVLAFFIGIGLLAKYSVIDFRTGGPLDPKISQTLQCTRDGEVEAEGESISVWACEGRVVYMRGPVKHDNMTLRLNTSQGHTP